MRTPTNTPFDQTQRTSNDVFGRKLAKRLDEAAADLPYDISERLRAARVRAIGQRQSLPMELAEGIDHAGNAAILRGPQYGSGWWVRFASVLPLLALVFGVILIDSLQDEFRAREIAEVDSELLTDDLPPTAYLDPGFAQFLRVNLPAKGQ